MTCVVVTRGGAGDVWRHATLQAATDHPITQLGDAIVDSAEAVLRTFTVSEMATLATKLGGPQLHRAISSWQSEASRADREHYAQQIWDGMRKLSAPAPTDDSEIVRVIRADRRAVRAAGGGTYRPHPEERGSLRSTREPRMSDTETKTKAVPREKKYSDESVITFGRDKDGNAYSAENNPKKADSKAHASFANYRDGETVKDLLARGGTTRNDVNYDVEKGYIVLG